MNKERLLSELRFKATRSSGPGGQHVNKTSTRVVLSWSLPETLAVTQEVKIRLREKLKNRLTQEGLILLSSQQSRSQHKNKGDVIKRFLTLIEASIQEPKRRKKTRPSRASKMKRLSNKKVHAQKKANRKKPDY